VKNRLGRKILILLLAPFIVVEGVALFAAIRLRTEFPSVRINSKGGAVEYVFSPTPPPGWVALSEISTNAKAAVVISEDWAFFNHHGIDWSQIREAAKVNLKKNQYVRGGSTISQQVVKNLFLSKEKTLLRKLKELLWTVNVEILVTKKKILETYFNIVEWGDQIYGIRQASQFYFGISPSLLGAKEGAFLAMLLPNPKKYSSSFRQKQLTPYAKKTTDQILFKMAQAGFLDFEQAKELSFDPLSFESVQMEEPLEEPLLEESPSDENGSESADEFLR